jgi:DNA repair protein RecN (Recombination protein N)
MIEELYIRNYALIDETRVHFAGKLNILTGETGAGKSVLIGALGLVLGNKADSTAIRTGCDEAEVSAVFHCGSQEISRWLEEHDLDPSEDTLIIRRKIRSTGRGAVYIQSRPFTLSDLSELGRLLVDVHGQHDHQSLFYIDQHRRFLDKSGKLEEINGEVQRLFNALKEKNGEIEELKATQENREKEIELLQFAVNEIEEADLKEGEEEELRKVLRRMEQAQELYGLLGGLLDLLPENRGGALSALSKAQPLIERLTEMEPERGELKNRFNDAFYELEDIAQSLAGISDEISYTPAEKEALEDRLAVVRKIGRKYGPAYEDVQKHLTESISALERLDSAADRLEAMSAERDALEEKLIAEARILSDKRRETALVLEKKIHELLTTLGMPSSSFSIDISQKTGAQGQALCGMNGLDRVEFLFSANRGEPLKSLRNVASGGEISRVMLAVKTALAGSDNIPVLVFDEIDAGIGGEVASSIGRHMKGLAGFHQILCITHLASIAVYADNHIKVKKSERENRTHTDLFSLEGNERVAEIARMLSGDSEGSASLTHAEQMLKGASV